MTKSKPSETAPAPPPAPAPVEKKIEVLLKITVIVGKRCYSSGTKVKLPQKTADSLIKQGNAKLC